MLVQTQQEIVSVHLLESDEKTKFVLVKRMYVEIWI